MFTVIGLMIGHSANQSTVKITEKRIELKFRPY